MNNIVKYLAAVILLSVSLPVSGQTTQISGVVLEDSQSGALPVIGAGVKIKDTSNGSVTDLDGRFSLSAKEGDVLEVSCLGYRGATVTVGKDNYYKIFLEPESMMLDQLVVVGYGSMKKSDLATSITSVNTDDMKIFPAATAPRCCADVPPA